MVLLPREEYLRLIATEQQYHREKKSQANGPVSSTSKASEPVPSTSRESEQAPNTSEKTGFGDIKPQLADPEVISKVRQNELDALNKKKLKPELIPLTECVEVKSSHNLVGLGEKKGQSSPPNEKKSRPWYYVGLTDE